MRRDTRPACRTRRGPRARPPRGSHGEVGPHCAAGAAGGGALRSPLERLVEVRHVDNVEAAYLLLHLGKGTVLHQTLAVPLPHRGRRGRGLQAGASDHDAGVRQCLGVGAIGAPVGVLAGRVRARAEIRFALVDQDRIFHGFPPSWDGLGVLPFTPMTSDRAPFRQTRPLPSSPSGGEGTVPSSPSLRGEESGDSSCPALPGRARLSAAPPPPAPARPRALLAGSWECASRDRPSRGSAPPSARPARDSPPAWARSARGP